MAALRLGSTNNQVLGQGDGMNFDKEIGGIGSKAMLAIALLLVRFS